MQLVGAMYAMRIPEDRTFGAWEGGGMEGKFVALKQGNAFHAMYVTDISGTKFWRLETQSWGYVYGPVHSSTTFEDVEGARYSWEDDDGFVHFAHATPAEHHEFAEFCEDKALATIQPILNDRTERYMVATTDGPIQVNARAEFQAWRAFAVQTQAFAKSYALAEPLGHWARNPDQHHARKIVGRAMAGTLNKWGAAKPDASEHNFYQKVRNEASKMALALQQSPGETIKTWPTHRAEVAAAEAAKKAKEAETQTPAEPPGDGGS